MGQNVSFTATAPDRRHLSFEKRVEAAEIAKSRPHPTHRSNNDETLYVDSCHVPTYITSYTKGLPHDRRTGLLVSPDHFNLFVDGINSGDPKDFKKIPLGPQGVPRSKRFQSGIAKTNDSFCFADVRAWESMGAGLVFDLEGPDAQAVTMPPAPALESHELVAEVSELYWMALLRDVNFIDFEHDPTVCAAVCSLNETAWVKMACKNPDGVSEDEKKRLRGPFSARNVFRGNTPGDDVGPYVSQFLLAGNTGIGEVADLSDGFIQYGAMRMDQRVRVATPGVDFMTTWESWLDVQNGADVRGRGSYESGEREYRFISSPRDMATYVHFDALYQAYLNACIIMLSMNIKFDAGIPFQGDDDHDKQQGFAHFGGPHVLSLVTEVATRALKAARFQKYNTHRRLRPEAIGGLLERYKNEPNNELFSPVRHLYDGMDKELLCSIAAHNGDQNKMSDFGKLRREDYSPEGESQETILLPMAFAEGSPMHPSYGAGHATVAAACVTILKAFFDHNATIPFAFVAVNEGRNLRDIRDEIGQDLTVEGELNKLCSNISIGRNWGGVHYFTDYRESIVMGEQVALGILEEQKITFGEDFSFTVPLFDGSERVI